MGSRARSAAVGAALLLAAVATPSAAHADGGGTDSIVLKDGSVLRGTLSEIAPGDHATIVLPNGQSAIVKWGYVDHIDRNGVAAQMPARPATPNVVIAPTPGATPTPAASAGKVHVHIETDDADVVLEHQEGREWRTVCAAPCDQDLPIDSGYRISGSGIRASRVFGLGGAPGDKLTISVDTASKGAFVGGIVLVSAGAVVAVVGVFVLIVVALADAVNDSISGNSSATSQNHGTAIAGWTMVGIGVAGAIAGAVLLGTNGKTKVEQHAKLLPDPKRYDFGPQREDVAARIFPRATGLSLPVLRF